jgi:CHASE2 domain-containing sensor protein
MTDELASALVEEVRRTLTDLGATRLAETAWPAVAGDLARLATGVERRDDQVVRAALALPAVGAVSALLLVGMGYLLGGVPVALGSAVLALLVLGVALAGTHTANDRRADRRHKGLAPSMEPTERPPTVVTEAIGRIEQLL